MKKKSSRLNWNSKVETTAISKLPRKPANVPPKDIAPEVPVATLLKFLIEIGGRLLSVPSSEAQVSELALANEIPSARKESGVGQKKTDKPAAAAIPPLASTCAQSRTEPFS